MRQCAVVQSVARSGRDTRLMINPGKEGLFAVAGCTDTPAQCRSGGIGCRPDRSHAGGTLR